MEDQYLIWAVICIAAALVLFVIEIFIPSGGILGVLSAAALVTGIVFLFLDNPTYGLIGMVCSLGAIPFLLYLAIKIWPSTPIAQWLTLIDGTTSSSSDPNGQTAESEQSSKPSMVGMTGKAMTALRPVGTCIIDGKRHECLAESGVIESGSEIKVTNVDGMHIKVRKIS